MAGQPYFPLYVGDWKKDPEVLDLDAEGRALWLEMLLLMHESQTGTLRETIGSYAKKCSLLYEQVSEGIDQIESSGVADVTRNEDDTVTIVCRRIEKELRERRLNRERQRRYRERHSEEDSVTDNDDLTDSTDSPSQREALHNAPNNGGVTSFTESEGENESEVEKKGKRISKRDVEGVYQLYPKKVGKRSALKAIRKALGELADREGVDDPVEWLSGKVKSFADSPKGQSGQFCPYPATWFNDWRFDDDPSVWQEKGDDNRIGLMTYDEARTHWEKRGSPGQFPGKQYEKVDRDEGKPLWRYAA